MVSHNITRVKALDQPVAPIFAESKSKDAKKESANKACGLSSKIILCKEATFQLISNIWTEAGLTNGAIGNVHSIIYAENIKPPALPLAIIAIFPDYLGPSFLPDIPGTVPVCPVKRDWFSNKISCSRLMVPMIVGYALLIHKLQGSTCDQIILNPGPTEFAAGLLLVGATQTKTYEGLTFVDPYPNFDHFEQIRKSPSLGKQMHKEEKMEENKKLTLEKYANVISKCFQKFKRQ